MAMADTCRRDLCLALRQPADLLTPLLFFVMVVTLFPLAIGPELSFLRDVGPGILWVSALLSVLLSVDHLFRHDAADGSLEQWVLQPQPLYLLVLARVLGHWVLGGLPLVLLAPLLGTLLGLSGQALGALCLTLLLGTPILSLIGAIGAALTLGLRGGGLLLALLVMPLYVPVLIFGTGTVLAAQAGVPVTGQLALMGAGLVMAVTLAPFACAAALRITLSGR
ncbi:heme exporter protein CcmB [Marinobacter sp. C2H3]|uniref:heme exporter protein CcmB n=1 Tax=Marinobacter sp. C2H3 TaxID=3119003 RepID=UPI00300F0FD1